MTRAEQAEATRQRLLEAARDEFQRNGYAGGRVDSIATRARVNKKLLYDHFGSKAELFGVVVADNVARVEAAVSFTADDLPGYAVRLFDYWTENPAAVRLFAWRNIEMSAAPPFEEQTYRSMTEAIEATGLPQRAGLSASHVLALVFAVLLAWAIPADVFQGHDDREWPSRRRSVRLAVERILTAD